MNFEKTLKNDENTEKEHKLSGYNGIGHLSKQTSQINLSFMRTHTHRNICLG